MQRFLRLRDFDWVLMALVFLLSALSVLEIYSATINTKFHGFESKQVLWLVGGQRRPCCCSPSSTITSCWT